MNLLNHTFLLGVLLQGALATLLPLKAVVITYPHDTPNSVLDQAKHVIKEAV
jgi:hypothetical protein